MEIKLTKKGWHKFEHFGATIVSKKYPKLTLEKFLIPSSYAVSTACFADYMAGGYLYLYFHVERAKEYLIKVLDYLDKETEAGNERGILKRLYWVKHALGRLENRTEEDRIQTHKNEYNHSKDLWSKMSFKEYLKQQDEYENNKYLFYDFEDSILGKKYTDYYFRVKQKDLIKSYEINMNHFANLKAEDFNKALSAFLENNSDFAEVKNINDVKNLSGYYILVLDEYKQVYIGATDRVYYRIMQHWRNIKQFDRRIFGDVEDSKISIDSFGALDTTRIFVMYDPFAMDTDFSKEHQFINDFPNEYICNRVDGGNPLSYFIDRRER